MADKTVMVLGGGIGGVVAANKLHHLLGREHRVIVVDKRPRHSFTGSYVWVLNGMRTAGQVERELSRLTRKGIGFVQGEVNAIDTAGSSVTVDDRKMEYDYLVVSLGADLDPGSIPGLPRAGINVYELEGLAEARRSLLNFSGGRLVIAICRMPYKCPAAPYEIAMFADDILRAQGVREKSEIEVVTWEPFPMPVAGKAMGDAVLSMMEPKGIAYKPNTTITSVDPENRQVVLEEGGPVPYDLLLYVPPHKCPDVIRDAGLTGEAPWVPVDPGTMATQHENVYVIGDATIIKLPNGKFLPKAGVFAHKHAETAAHQIAAKIKSGASAKPYDGVGYCFIETGGGVAGFAKGNFYADPDPLIKPQKPSKLMHLGKILFEKYWFWRYL